MILLSTILTLVNIFIIFVNINLYHKNNMLMSKMEMYDPYLQSIANSIDDPDDEHPTPKDNHTAELDKPGPIEKIINYCNTMRDTRPMVGEPFDDMDDFFYYYHNENASVYDMTYHKVRQIKALREVQVPGFVETEVVILFGDGKLAMFETKRFRRVRY